MGNKSKTATFVAAEAVLLVTVIVNTTVAPTAADKPFVDTVTPKSVQEVACVGKSTTTIVSSTGPSIIPPLPLPVDP